jgi:DNA-directed RNA polymerase beta' subunit
MQVAAVEGQHAWKLTNVHFSHSVEQAAIGTASSFVAPAAQHALTSKSSPSHTTSTSYGIHLSGF